MYKALHIGLRAAVLWALLMGLRGLPKPAVAQSVPIAEHHSATQSHRPHQGGVDLAWGTASQETGTRAVLRRIPVVIHVVHLPSDEAPREGTSNPTHEQIIRGLRSLNDAFNNEGVFAGGPFYTSAKELVSSVDTDIEFTLATVDTNGFPLSEPPILRRASKLSDITFIEGNTSDEEALKQGAWNPSHYLNIWLVNEFCSPSGCEPKGHAYRPGLGRRVGDRDGIIIEAGNWGLQDTDGAVAAFYAGRYLDLWPTYHSPNQYGECSADGDEIDDTPVDNTIGMPPGFPWEDSTYLGCANDIAGSHGFFQGDVGEMFENFMDGDKPDYKNTFTPDQMSRMRKTLLDPTKRAGVADSTGFQVRILDVALSSPAPIQVPCVLTGLQPRMTLTNNGTEAVTKLTMRYTWNGQDYLYVWEDTLAAGESRTVDLALALTMTEDQQRVIVRVEGINGIAEADYKPQDNSAQVTFVKGYRFPVSDPPTYCRNIDENAVPADWRLAVLDDVPRIFTITPREDCPGPGDFMIQHERQANAQYRLPSHDFMVGPEFDLDGYGNATFKFNVAYRRQAQRSNPTVRVWAMRCGQPLQLLYEQDGAALAEGSTILEAEPTNPWWPACEDWQTQKVDITAFGGSKVRLILEIQSDSGQATPRLFLDDICIEAKESCAPPDVIPHDPGQTVRADRICYGTGGWMHFVKDADQNFPLDRLLFSMRNQSGQAVNIRAADVAMVLTEQYGEGAYDLSDSAGYAENALGWHVANRYIEVNPSLELSEPMEVRVYFDQVDFSDLQSQVPHILGPQELVLFQLEGNRPGSPATYHREIGAGAYQEFLPGTELGPGRWLLQEHDSYYSATLLVKQLRVIGIGSGGDGVGLGARYPVAFKPFDVYQERSKVHVSGTLKRERGTTTVELYRAPEAEILTPGAFESIAERPARVNAAGGWAYDFTDAKPWQGYNYYYLRVSHESGFQYTSDTVRIKFDEGKLVTAYPNPIEENGELNFLIDAQGDVDVRLEILNAARVPLIEHSWKHRVGQPARVNLSALPAGVYFYRVMYQGKAYWGKLMRYE